MLICLKYNNNVDRVQVPLALGWGAMAKPGQLQTVPRLKESISVTFDLLSSRPDLDGFVGYAMISNKETFGNIYT